MQKVKAAVVYHVLVRIVLVQGCMVQFHLVAAPGSSLAVANMVALVGPITWAGDILLVLPLLLP